MKIFEKVKCDSGRRRIYLCGIQIASYRRKSKIREFTYFDYSFSLASPHGAGENSLLYYLELIQLPCVQEFNPYAFSYFSNKFKSIGIALIETLPKSDPNKMNLFRPMIILMRDPIELLTSIFNFTENYAFSSIPSHERTLKECIIAIINNGHCLLKPISERFTNYSEVIVIGTHDIRQENVKNTMRNLAEKLGGKYTQEIDDELLVTHSHTARIWYDFSVFNMAGINVKIFPKNNVASYSARSIKWRNADFSPLTSDYDILYKDVWYSVVKFDDKERTQPYNDDVIKRKIQKNLDLFEMHETLYNKYKITPEDLIKEINADPDFREQVINAYKPDAELVEKFDPGHTQQWKYWQKILEN